MSQLKQRPTIKLYPKFKANPFMIADFYKPGHLGMQLEGEQFIYSNVTPRFNRHSKTGSKKVVIFGLQMFLKDWMINYWTEKFFNLPKEEACASFFKLMRETIGITAVGIKAVEDLWELGYMPLSVKSVKEGARVNIGVAIMTVTNTVKGYGWLAQYIETKMQSEVWKAITSATDACAFRKMLDFWAEMTSSCPEFVDFQGHDFSNRGMDGVFSMVKSSTSHLIFFKGTDSMVAIDELQRQYNATGFIGTSVAAQEHSVSTKFIAFNMSQGMNEEEAEFEMIRHFVQDRYPAGIISMIADTKDYWRYVTEFLPRLKDVIMNREVDAIGMSKVTIRPDSSPDYSSPIEMLAGFEIVDLSQGEAITRGTHVGKVAKLENEKFYLITKDGVTNLEIPDYEVKGTVEVLWDIFGGIVNDKGFKELDSHIGVIYGDSISFEIGNKICARLAKKGFASTNWIAGIGSFQYQFTTRDSYGIAMKATSCTVNDVVLSLQKTPKTDPTKNSAAGYLRIEKEGNNYVQYQNQTTEQEQQGELIEVFRDSVLLVDYTLEDVQANLKADSQDDEVLDYIKIAE